MLRNVPMANQKARMENVPPMVRANAHKIVSHCMKGWKNDHIPEH